VEILIGWRDRDPAQVEVDLGRPHLVHRPALGGVDAGEADQLLRVAIDIFSHVLIRDFSAQNSGF